MEALVIRTADPTKWIEFSDAEPKGLPTPIETYVFTVQLANLRASTRRLHAYNDYAKDGRRLGQVFSEMASEWRGWKGEKMWRSTDGEVRLAFIHDHVGLVHVSLDVKDSPAWNWKVTAEVALEIGSLEKLARDVAAYFRA